MSFSFTFYWREYIVNTCSRQSMKSIRETCNELRDSEWSSFGEDEVYFQRCQRTAVVRGIQDGTIALYPLFDFHIIDSNLKPHNKPMNLVECPEIIILKSIINKWLLNHYARILKSKVMRLKIEEILLDSIGNVESSLYTHSFFDITKI